MEEILVIKLGAFGDVIQAEGALRDIRAHHRGARITVLTRAPFRRILERCPSVDRVWVDDNAPRWRLDRMVALARRLRGAGFRRIYDLQNSARTAFYHRWLAGPTEWSGTAPGSDLPHRHPAPKTLPSLERLAGQLADAGVPVVRTPHPDPGWMAEDVSAILASAGVAPPYVVLLPGSSARHPHKRWPHYAELAAGLARAGRLAVVVPGPDEVEECRAIPAVPLMEGGRVLDFFRLAGVLKGAAFVVGNDSGPTHLAAHLGTPGLGLFGRSHLSARMTGVERPGFRVLEVDRLAELPLAPVLEAVVQAVPPASAGAGPASLSAGAPPAAR